MNISAHEARKNGFFGFLLGEAQEAADGGEVESIDEWGKRKLAYPINYIPEGYYVLMNFSADSNVPAELERNYRIVEDVMRHVIIRKDA